MKILNLFFVLSKLIGIQLKMFLTVWLGLVAYLRKLFSCYEIFDSRIR